LLQTERLGRLVAELLDLSRLDGGALPVNPEDVAVLDLLREAVGQRDQIQISVTPSGLKARTDPARLHQVVANLLDNALRHSPAGELVRLEARALEAGGLQVEVIDCGPGIPEQERSLVFERFTRGGASDGGTGLGLAIARWAVELQGGSIAVVGQPPGCRIRVSLPEERS
jgi:signal transduction histidine kinase